MPWSLFSIFITALLLQQTPALQDSERRLGPFTIGGQTFTVVVYNKRLGNSETMFALEIRDQTDDIQYARTFPYEVRDGKFRETISVAAKLVPGKPAPNLLLQYTTKRTPARKNMSSQIFGLSDGKLVLIKEL